MSTPLRARCFNARHCHQRRGCNSHVNIADSIFWGTPELLESPLITQRKASALIFFSSFYLPKRAFLCFTAYFYVFLVYRITDETLFLLSLQRKGRLNCRKLQIWLNPLHYNKRRFSLSTMSKPRKF